MRLLQARKIAHVALDGIDDEPPLRLLANFAQRRQLVSDLCWQPKTDLRVILDARAAIAGGWTSDFSECGFAFRGGGDSHLRLC